MSILLVAGLGNPGREYAETRHNAGAAVDRSPGRAPRADWRRSLRFSVAARPLGPGTGRRLPAGQARDVHERQRTRRPRARRLPPDSAGRRIIAVYDDLTIELGRVKITQRGSAGGHNGVASLLEHLGGGFIRYRIGIGPKHPPEMDLKDFVLGKFTPDEQTLFNHQLTTYTDGLGLLIDRGPAEAMNQLNRRDP